MSKKSITTSALRIYNQTMTFLQVYCLNEIYTNIIGKSKDTDRVNIEPKNRIRFFGGKLFILQKIDQC